MKKIIIKKGIKMGATIGAFMYAYYIDFGTGYSYTFEATEEGIGQAASIWEQAGYEIEWKEIERG